MTQVKYLREQTKGVKHVSFDPSGRYVAVSCSDGVIYVYSVDGPEPELVQKVDGIIGALETDDEATSKVAWHPDGTAFAAVETTRDVAVVAVSDWTKQNKFSGGHNGTITAIAWSPNGALLATAGADRQITLWETRSQRILRKYDFPNVVNIGWHPTNNEIAFTTSDGELFIHPDFVPSENRRLLEKGLEIAPLRSVGDAATSEIPTRSLENTARADREDRRRRGTPDSLDDILGPMDEDEDFVEDDDGAGYAEGVNGFGKRTNGHLDYANGHDAKRRLGAWQPRSHEPFQPGSTPWRSSRRYLCKLCSLVLSLPLPISNRRNRPKSYRSCLDRRSGYTQYRHSRVL